MNPLGNLNPQTQAAYLRTLPAIRERCSRVHDLATQGKLEYFDYHPEKEDSVAEFCLNIIKVHPLSLLVLTHVNLCRSGSGTTTPIQPTYASHGFPLLKIRATDTTSPDPPTWSLAPP